MNHLLISGSKITHSSIIYSYMVHFSAQARKIKKSTPQKIHIIQKNGTRVIFRILSNIYDRMFCKNSHLAHFLSPCSKNKKNSSQENILYSNIKNFLYFLKRKLFLYFKKWKPRKNFIMNKITRSCCVRI